MNSLSSVLTTLFTSQSQQSAVNGRTYDNIADRLFTMHEVSLHSDSSACWVVIDNYVYDLTEFLPEHPGGLDILFEHAGRDCTEVFKEVGHSSAAASLLRRYKIGMLQMEDRISP